MVSDPVKPQPSSHPPPIAGYGWKHRQRKCSHGFVVGLGLCPHAGCIGARKRFDLPQNRGSYSASKDMTVGSQPGLYRCYICKRWLSDGTVPELGPSQFFGAVSKKNTHQSRCKKCDNRRRWQRRWYGTAEGPRRGGAGEE